MTESAGPDFDMEKYVREKLAEAIEKDMRDHCMWSPKLGRWLTEDEVMYGTGTAEPLGILNAPPELVPWQQPSVYTGFRGEMGPSPGMISQAEYAETMRKLYQEKYGEPAPAEFGEASRKFGR